MKTVDSQFMKYEVSRNMKTLDSCLSRSVKYQCMNTSDSHFTKYGESRSMKSSLGLSNNAEYQEV